MSSGFILPRFVGKAGPPPATPDLDYIFVEMLRWLIASLPYGDPDLARCGDWLFQAASLGGLTEQDAEALHCVFLNEIARVARRDAESRRIRREISKMNRTDAVRRAGETLQ
jgi:hypothetical protein